MLDRKTFYKLAGSLIKSLIRYKPGEKTPIQPAAFFIKKDHAVAAINFLTFANQGLWSTEMERMSAILGLIDFIIVAEANIFFDLESEDIPKDERLVNRRSVVAVSYEGIIPQQAVLLPYRKNGALNVADLTLIPEESFMNFTNGRRFF